MKSPQHKKRQNKLAWLLITISVIIVVLYVILANVFSLWPFNQSSAPANNQSEEIQPSSSQNPPQNEGDKQIQQNDQPVGSEDKNGIFGVINYAAVRDDTLQLRVTIDQALTDGDCKLTLTHVSTQKKIIKNAPVIANPSSATCEGYDIPVQDLTPGKWLISVLITSGGEIGEIKSEVTI